MFLGHELHPLAFFCFPGYVFHRQLSSPNIMDIKVILVSIQFRFITFAVAHANMPFILNQARFKRSLTLRLGLISSVTILQEFNHFNELIYLVVFNLNK